MSVFTPPTAMSHRTIRGEILYTSKKPEKLDQVRGREAFSMTRHTDGKVTIRAQCEIEDPAPTVLRDVVYSLDENRRPMDCHLRLTIGDRFFASAWFRMGEGYIECDSYSPGAGRLSQRVEIDGYYDGFGSHPIVVDGYNTKCMDIAKGPHKRIKRSFLSSLDHRGASPPMIAESRIYTEYVGEEDVTVAAGQFRCRHFRISDEGGAMMSAHGAHPDYDVWVTADEDSIFVKGGVAGYMQTWYELVWLERA